MPITNVQMAEHEFLVPMRKDDYYPSFLVDKVVAILVEMCERIEAARPNDEASLLAITHEATAQINALNSWFWNNDSDIDTPARESIAADFAAILEAYGHVVDVEAAIANRDW